MGFLVRAAMLVGVGALAYRVFARPSQPTSDNTPAITQDDAPYTIPDVTNEFETRLAAVDPVLGVAPSPA